MRVPAWLIVALLLAQLGVAQDLGDASAKKADPTPAEKLLSAPAKVAFVDVGVYVGDGSKLDKVTVLVEDGKILRIGKDLEVPGSFERIQGGVLTPGLVIASSTVSLARTQPKPRTIILRGRRRMRMPRSTRRTVRPRFTPTVKATAKIQRAHRGWADALEGGVTTHGLRPPEAGLSGLGAAVRPVAATKADMVLADEQFLWLGMVANTATKKMLRDSFKKAKELIEARKKKPSKAAPKAGSATKKPAGKAKPSGKAKPTSSAKPTDKPAPSGKPKKPATKPSAKPGQTKKPATKKPSAKKPAAKKEDPKIALLTKVIDKGFPIMAGVSGAGAVLHVLDALKDTSFPLTFWHAYRSGAQDTLDRVIPQLKARKARVVLPVRFGYRPNTSFYCNPILTLRKAGIDVVLQPGISKTDLQSLWYRLANLARSGIAKAKLIELLTLAPAKLIGADKRVGSIAKGKDANLLHFSRDPFSPAARLIHVWFEGRKVKSVKTRN